MSRFRQRFGTPLGLGLTLTVTLSLPGTAPAAPGDVSHVPLFAATSVQPNVFFLLDDSQSMTLGLLKTNAAAEAHPITCFSEGVEVDCATGRALVLYGNAVSPRFPPDRDDRMLEWCAGYNVLAYNPELTYTPWAGADGAGVPYADRALASACDDPFDPNTCGQDITGWFYFAWSDAVADGGDGDGEYDVGECPRICADDPVSGCGTITVAVCRTIEGCVVASDLTAEQQANFANWYSYYRKREYVLKAAVSPLIADSSHRMGLATLHNTGSASTGVRNMADTASTVDCDSDPATPEVTYKNCLLERLFRVNSDDGGETPLRRGLDEVGRYFDATDGGAGHEFLAGEDSPILSQDQGGNCQQNFTIMVSDGAWNRDWPTTDSAGAVLTSHGDADSDNSSAWDGGSHADGPTDSNCGDDEPALKTDTLADIAMRYYETDLSSADNDVPTLADVDENEAQHLVTFGVAFGVVGTKDRDPPNRTSPFDWPGVCAGDATTIDDMRHAAWNGRGGFLSARDPNKVVRSLETAVKNISSRTAASASSVGFSSTRLGTDTLLFQSLFSTVDWSGDLRALRVDADTGAVNFDNPAWSAADQLDARDPADRVILTLGVSGDGAAVGAAFAWANLSAAQKNDLRNGATDEIGRERLDYLRGDRDCEDGCTAGADTLNLRVRGSALGDIVGSGPLAVGAPALNWPSSNTSLFPTASGETYAEFKTGTAKDRNQVVYVGANDGMFHGFDTTDGRELLAYIPSSLFSAGSGEGLHYLTEAGFNDAHRFYTDRTPAVSDVYLPESGGDWMTVAVGGLGAGGRGLYALDITNPEDFSEDSSKAADVVLWEFSSTDDAELGLTMSQPIIVPTNATDTTARWAVIVGSGYNDTGSNQAHLFIVFLAGPGADGVWDEGTEYVKIEATLAVAALTERNGMSSPTVADLDGNGTADRVYMGDLLGNLWAFDLTGSDPTGWDVAERVDNGDGTTTATPLFTAKIDTPGQPTQVQPITVKPVISKHPTQLDTGNLPNVMVFFGTGQYLTEADKTTTDNHTFYGVWDRGDYGLQRTDLQEQEILGGTSVNGVAVDVVTDAAVNYDGPDADGARQYGWYLGLPDTGERVVVDAVLYGGNVLFNSLVPELANVCTGGGSGFFYALDMVNGGRPDAAPFDVDQDQSVNNTDLVSVVSDAGDTLTEQVVGRIDTGGVGVLSSPVIIDGNLYTGTSETNIIETTLRPLEGADTGRLSWQQLFR